MLTLWTKIANIGIKESYDSNTIRSVKLTNQFSVFSILVYVSAGLNNLYFGEYFSFVVLESIAFVLALGIVFNYFGMHEFSSHFQLIVNNVVITYFNFYTDISSSVFLFYFPLILAGSFLFDFQKKKQIFFHFLFTVLMIYLVVTVDHSFLASKNLTPEYNKHLLNFDLIAVAFSIGFFIYIINKGSEEQQQNLLQQIEKRKEIENEISHTLKEKEILVSEIHHRVKNNLAIISSLLNLQSESTDDITAKSILMESRNRIISMALIHDKLYLNERLNNINFRFYISELVHEIHQSYTSLQNKDVKINLDLSEVYLNVNYAIPCGLIINEVLTNCYKHAFNERENGQIFISLKKELETIFIEIWDNGSGFLHNKIKTESVGMDVIQSLVKQIDGIYEFATNSGTIFKMQFIQNEKINKN